MWWIRLHPTAGALWPSRVLYYLFVWLGGVLDGFQGMSLVFQLIVELPQFGSSITSLLIDPLAAFITHLLLLSCVHILTLDSFKDTQPQMWWWLKQLFLSPVGGPLPPLFLPSYKATDCYAHPVWSVCRRDQKPGRKGNTVPSWFQTPMKQGSEW